MLRNILLKQTKVQPALSEVVAQGIEFLRVFWWQGLFGLKPGMAERQRGDECAERPSIPRHEA
jgi:hypothetical protein